jgi:hypothetical protein
MIINMVNVKRARLLVGCSWVFFCLGEEGVTVGMKKYPVPFVICTRHSLDNIVYLLLPSKSYSVAVIFGYETL